MPSISDIYHSDSLGVFRHASVSSTHPGMSGITVVLRRITVVLRRITVVLPSVTLSNFHSVRVSGEKLKKADPNYFSILGLGRIS